jgi:hypothetical protein
LRSGEKAARAHQPQESKDIGVMFGGAAGAVLPAHRANCVWNSGRLSGKHTEQRINSQSGYQFRHSQSESGRKQFQVSHANLFLSIFQVRDKAAINSDVFSHIHLCPPALLPKCA